jgi:transcriptional regulator with PAS, ATPase and Fis domain
VSENTDLLVGTSAQILSVKNLARKVAFSNCTVLICGDTGTGKELVAQMIHLNSQRSAFPMVSLNCAAIPDTLIEAELFGHEKGAFTGAWRRSEGRIAEANHGTLFLDEVGEMNLYAQAKLLRALEMRQVQRLGASGATQVDVRVVAATNQNLEQLVSAGRFRKDLFFRLNVAKITLPALTARRSDIPVLARHFLTSLGKLYARPPLDLTEQAWDVTRRYEWPGNVRELKNAIEFALIHQPWPHIAVEHLPENIQQATEIAGDDRGRILEVLQGTNWNKSEAAKQLHWSRMTLYRKMSRYAIIDQAARSQPA